MKKPKNLTINKVTLRDLDDPALIAVAGRLVSPAITHYDTFCTPNAGQARPKG
jgi:hypothetical protein